MKFCPPLLGTSPCYWWINNATAPVTHFVAGEACLINDRTLLDEKKRVGTPKRRVPGNFETKQVIISYLLVNNDYMQ